MTARRKLRKIDRQTIDEIEQTIMSAPRRAAPSIDPVKEQRKREKFIRVLDEVEAALTAAYGSVEAMQANAARYVYTLMPPLKGAVRRQAGSQRSLRRRT